MLVLILLNCSVTQGLDVFVFPHGIIFCAIKTLMTQHSAVVPGIFPDCWLEKVLQILMLMCRLCQLFRIDLNSLSTFSHSSLSYSSAFLLTLKKHTATSSTTARKCIFQQLHKLGRVPQISDENTDPTDTLIATLWDPEHRIQLSPHKFWPVHILTE